MERDAFLWMDLNDRATGDAVIFVVVSRVLLLLGAGFSILGLATSVGGISLLLRSLVNALIFWLAFAGILLGVVRFLFQGEGSYPFYLRVVGFAYPTLLLIIFTGRLGLEPLVALLLGSVWFLAIVTSGIRYVSDLAPGRAAAAGGGAMIGWIVIAQILGRGLI